MKFKADEIASVLRQEIASYRKELDVTTVGRVIEVGDGIARVYGLTNAMAGEMLDFGDGVMGQVFNLEEDSIGAVIYGDFALIKEGQAVRGTGKMPEMPVGQAVVGRVINPLAQPLDGLGEIKFAQVRPVEFAAPGIAQRQPVVVPLQTGIKSIDAMTPIGRGQRELIIGDRKTGKTAIAIDAIINQADTGVLCIYVAIGQKESSVAGVVETLRKYDAMKHTVVISAGSAMPAPLQFLAPYTGATIAEHFMYDLGRDALVIYDDLSKHATAYRQLSLLLRRPPGREAYPGDIFYLHSRLLERAAKLADKYVLAPAATPESAIEVQGADGKVYERVSGLKEAKEALAKRPDKANLKVHHIPNTGGSMTALPIVETLEGEVSAYIPTNVISITDGQIYLEPNLFFAGVRPAINVGISVSRVGAAAQIKAMKQVAASLRLDLAAFRELEAFAQLGTELGAATQRQLDRGARMVELLKQPRYQPYAVMDQVISISAGARGFLDDLPLEDVGRFEKGLIEHVKVREKAFYDALLAAKELSDADKAKLDGIIKAFKEKFVPTARRAAGAEKQ
jgi:F-type H+-transporting ATPase subunit alpha